MANTQPQASKPPAETASTPGVNNRLPGWFASAPSMVVAANPLRSLGAIAGRHAAWSQALVARWLPDAGLPVPGASPLRVGQVRPWHGMLDLRLYEGHVLPPARAFSPGSMALRLQRAVHPGSMALHTLSLPRGTFAQDREPTPAEAVFEVDSTGTPEIQTYGFPAPEELAGAQGMESSLDERPITGLEEKNRPVPGIPGRFARGKAAVTERSVQRSVTGRETVFARRSPDAQNAPTGQPPFKAVPGRGAASLQGRGQAQGSAVSRSTPSQAPVARKSGVTGLAARPEWPFRLVGPQESHMPGGTEAVEPWENDPIRQPDSAWNRGGISPSGAPGTGSMIPRRPVTVSSTSHRAISPLLPLQAMLVLPRPDAAHQQGQPGTVALQPRGDWPLLEVLRRAEREPGQPGDSSALQALRRMWPEAAPLLREAAQALSALGPGEPLQPEVRGAMEAQLGQDLGEVRLHTSALAQTLHAEAFTSGRHVVFAPGRMQMNTSRGLALLGHELTHVGQPLAFKQESSAPQAPEDSGERAAREQEANIQRVIEQGWPEDGALTFLTSGPAGSPLPGSDRAASRMQRAQQARASQGQGVAQASAAGTAPEMVVRRSPVVQRSVERAEAETMQAGWAGPLQVSGSGWASPGSASTGMHAGEIARPGKTPDVRVQRSVQIDEVTTEVRTTDSHGPGGGSGGAALSPQAMQQLVRLVYEELKKRMRAERIRKQVDERRAKDFTDW
jgi:hypothetical protein